MSERFSQIDNTDLSQNAPKFQIPILTSNDIVEYEAELNEENKLDIIVRNLKRLPNKERKKMMKRLKIPRKESLVDI